MNFDRILAVLSRFNKLWAALIGLGLGYLQRKYGVDLFPVQQDVVDLAIAGLTGLLVYVVPNTTPNKEVSA